MNKPLDAYRAKRDFAKTPEPAGKKTRRKKAGNSYVIQKHAARRLHYDFRLEMNGVLKSWAVPEGPSLVPGEKRLAVHVEDHPLEYGGFEGVIPKGEYGGGTVMLWDRGTWEPEFDPEFGYKKGHLKFRLNGEKLKGAWHLVRMAPKPREKQEAWLLFKSEDEFSRPPGSTPITEDRPDSVASGRSIEEIAEDRDNVWSSKQGGLIKSKKPKPKKRIDFSALPGAKKAPLPSFIEPCLPTTVAKAPGGKDWVHEIKYDGYRIQARIDAGKTRLLTRSGLDWTEKFKRLARAFADLPVDRAILDGEVVVQSDTGAASFTRLVDALSEGAEANIVYYAFDLLYADGFDLRGMTLVKRKEALARILTSEDGGPVLFSEHLTGDGDLIFRHSCRLGLEGIVSKKASAPYRSGRVTTWTKTKCAEEGPFVIAGFVPSTVAKGAVGALVLGERVNGKLVPSGHVGTGFSDEMARELGRKLDALRRKTPVFADPTAEAKKAKWVEPELVAEIEYRSRTGGNIIRHASFKRLLEDTSPEEVVRPGSKPPGKTSGTAPEIRLTNPGRLLWPADGVTKQGLADFYTEIADWILPHIVDRPLSLLRCPGGIAQECFFQKHKWAGLGSAVRLVPVPESDEPMLAIDALPGLLELVQAGVLEIHPWGAKADRPELPDRITLDLDPGENVPWNAVVDAAHEVRARLKQSGLESFVKTTGGKGLHVVVPLLPKADWPTVKAFAQQISIAMARDDPRRYVDNMSKRVRPGRIYVDYLRNGMGATAVSAYSTRARTGATVSTPLAWEELGPGIRPSHFTVRNLPQRLAYLDRDPWAELQLLQQQLPAANAKAPPRSGGRSKTKPSAA